MNASIAADVAMVEILPMGIIGRISINQSEVAAISVQSPHLRSA
jgi:hypothetical protein